MNASMRCHILLYYYYGLSIFLALSFFSRKEQETILKANKLQTKAKTFLVLFCLFSFFLWLLSSKNGELEGFLNVALLITHEKESLLGSLDI